MRREPTSRARSCRCGRGSRRAQQRQDRGNYDIPGSEELSCHFAGQRPVGSDSLAHSARDDQLTAQPLRAALEAPSAGQDTRQMPRFSIRFQCAALAGWLVVGAALERSSAPGPTGPGAAVVQSRQPDPRLLHRQLPRRPRAARGETGERRSDRRGSNRVCRRARTSGCRLHQIHLSPIVPSRTSL